ncbi:hypothetical protein V8C42DRAFT_309048 [Trichoderma barbatum]
MACHPDYPPVLPTQKLLQTALASTHAYKPTHTLFTPLSLHVRPLPLSLASVFRCPFSTFHFSPRQILSCLCASPPPHPTKLGPCTFVPSPEPDGSAANSISRLRPQQRCERYTLLDSYYYGTVLRLVLPQALAPKTCRPATTTCAPPVSPFWLLARTGRSAHHCASRHVLGTRTPTAPVHGWALDAH